MHFVAAIVRLDTALNLLLNWVGNLPQMKGIYLVAKCIEKLAPASLAESWDNTGVLIGCNDMQPKHKRILLTIDLTRCVLEECISKSIDLVVCYHPVIFHPVRKVTDELVIRCIQNNISVYSPHTQLDPLMNKFILDFLGDSPGTLQDIAARLKGLSGMKTLRVVRRLYSNVPRAYANNGDIRVGVGAAFRNIDAENCLLITGEMSHHDLLRCRHNGVEVIMMEHSNSERIFLEELKRLMEDDDELSGYEIVISESDKDPVEFM